MAIVTIVLKGKINNDIIYRLCPSTEFSEGVWNLCLLSIAFSCASNINELCSISCNMVKSQKLNEEYSVECYEQPLGMCLLNSEKSKNIHYFGKSFKMFLNFNI